MISATLDTSRYKLRKRKIFYQRILKAALAALLLHLFFIFILAPILRFDPTKSTPIEVTEISQKDLAELKKKIIQNRQLAPLLEQEIQEKYRSKEAPKDAKFMSKFNQVVPEETVAGAQSDAPQIGAQNANSGSKSNSQKQKERVKQEPLKLSNLGLGTKYIPKSQDQPNENTQSVSGPQGPNQPFRPVGRDDPKLKKSGNNLLNAIENQYYSFFARFEEPIIRNWYFLLRNSEGKMRQEMAAKRVRNGDDLPVTIEFTINREGNFTRIEILQSSGVPTLDWSTKEAIKKLGSLSNPPPGVFEGKSTFTYRLQFIVSISDAPVSTTAPGMIWY